MVCYGLLANPPCNIFIGYGDLTASHVWWHQGVPVLLFPAAAPSDWTQRVNLEFWAQGDEERRLNLFFGEDLRKAKALVKNSDSSSTNMDLTWFISATVMIWLTTMVISPTKIMEIVRFHFLEMDEFLFFFYGNIMERKGGRFRLAVGPQHIWTTSTWPSHGGWTCWTRQHHVHSDSAASWHT